MATNFLDIVKRMIQRHGVNVTYTRVSASVYDVASGTSTNTSQPVSIRSYPRHIRASQFNQPHLINKDVIEFYVAFDALPVAPKIKDTITYSSNTYVVDSYSEHTAHSQVCLYKIIAVRA